MEDRHSRSDEQVRFGKLADAADVVLMRVADRSG
jgi:hypothetical protein